MTDYWIYRLYILAIIFIEHKNEYYANLRKITEEANWQDWILYMLDMEQTLEGKITNYSNRETDE
jgi:hypothetical protein